MGVLVPVIVLSVWEAAVWLGLLSARYFPPPTAIAATFAHLIAGGVLWKEALVTLARLAAAFLLAAAPAVALGLAMGLWRPVRSAVEPYVALLYPLPKIALLPLLLIVLGVGEAAFVVTGAITAFFQIVLSTAGGVQSLDPRLIEVGRNYGARGVGLFRKIILPGALPAIFTGLRLGLGLALITVIVVEFVTAKSGLGHLVFRSWQMLLTAEMFAAFALIGLIGLALTRGLRLLQQRALAWTPPERELT
jgi:ABC-type nitrate/sulfonate/bicarbonate transport system permease component